MSSCTPDNPQNTGINGWQKLGVTNDYRFNDPILCMTFDQNNNLFIGGSFSFTSGGPSVAKWNGTDWIEVKTNQIQPTPFYSYGINSIVSDANNNIYVAGGCYTVSINGTYIPKWNGTSWTSELRRTNENLGDGNVAIDPDGKIITYYLSNNVFLKWNGSLWVPFAGNGIPIFNQFNGPSRMLFDRAGNFYASGAQNSSSKYYVAKWNGSTWAELGGSNTSIIGDKINCMAINKNSGEIYVGGDFVNQYGKNYVAKWNGNNWTELGGTNTSTFNDRINDIALDNQGNVYVVGDFFEGYSFHHYVAKWNGSTWSKLDGGDIFFNDRIRCIAIDRNNKIYVAGDFVDEKFRNFVAVYN